jgi:hypothetical protein
LGQKKYAQAEASIVPGYEGLKAREAVVPPPARSRLSEAGGRVVKLYEAWGKKDQAEWWRKKLHGDIPAPFEIPDQPFAQP